jgi:hypothetical protein
VLVSLASARPVNLRRFFVEPALGKLGQLVVGGTLFFQSFL